MCVMSSKSQNVMEYYERDFWKWFIYVLKIRHKNERRYPFWFESQESVMSRVKRVNNLNQDLKPNKIYLFDSK